MSNAHVTMTMLALLVIISGTACEGWKNQNNRPLDFVNMLGKSREAWIKKCEDIAPDTPPNTVVCLKYKHREAHLRNMPTAAVFDKGEVTNVFLVISKDNPEWKQERIKALSKTTAELGCQGKPERLERNGEEHTWFFYCDKYTGMQMFKHEAAYVGYAAR